MTSRQSGSKGYKSPPSSPSSGSEDNGFTNRPLVAGLSVKNLSREELDELSKEGIYGPTGNPNDRPRDGGSQRSLNLPGSSREDYLGRVISQTPQPSRRADVRDRGIGGPSGISARKFHHGKISLERGSPGQSRDQTAQISPESGSMYGSSEFPAAWRDQFRSGASPGGSAIDVRNTEKVPRMPYRVGRDPKRPQALPPRLPSSSTRARGDRPISTTTRRSPPPYSGLSPSEDPLTTRIRPRIADKGSPYECPSSPLPRNGKDREASKQSSPRSDTSKVEEAPSPPMTEKPISPESKRSESPPREKRAGARVQDSTRLRPPLAGTAGTSADSGTGDSGSAEIQADVVTPQATSSDVLDASVAKNEGRSPDSRTPGSKGGKQTVKPFTKDSLDRLENKTVQLVREYGFQPKRKMSVEDGAVLPNKFEPFPTELYGRPLEEIDNFIYDEVSPMELSRAVYFAPFASPVTPLSGRNHLRDNYVNFMARLSRENRRDCIYSVRAPNFPLPLYLPPRIPPPFLPL